MVAELLRCGRVRGVRRFRLARRRPRTRREPKTPGTPALALMLSAALLVPGAVSATTDGLAGTAREPARMVEKPASVAKRSAPTHTWFDGKTPRMLTLDPTRRADFSPKASGAGPSAVLRSADGPLKDVSPALQSPVLHDEGGRARALPGGVLLVVADGLDDAATQALLARHGASAARLVAERIWLLPSPPGLESLDLANRLAASGGFESAQPNWWVERIRK